MLTQDQLVMAFGVLFPTENVSPDMSTIEAIRTNWRGSSPCPSDADIQAAWDSVADQVQDQLDQQQAKVEYAQQGLNTDAMVLALWKQIMENDPSQANSLQAIRSSALAAKASGSNTKTTGNP